MIPYILTALGGYLIGSSVNQYAKGGQVQLLAPNGKPSNLTPEQYRLVRTPEFKAWFGDWEKDTENGSKVVDENGEPLVVWHGSDNKFNLFDIKKAKKDGFHGKGFYFSLEDLEYGKNKYKVFLKMMNPFQMEREYEVDEIKRILGDKYEDIKSDIDRELEWSYNGKINGFIFYNTAKNDMLIKAGYDGIIHGYIRVAFEPTQIKLANGTNTTFDGSNPDIRYNKGSRA